MAKAEATRKYLDKTLCKDPGRKASLLRDKKVSNSDSSTKATSNVKNINYSNDSTLTSSQILGDVICDSISLADSKMDYLSVLFNYGNGFDEMVDSLFTKHKFIEVMGSWIFIIILDITLGFPVEWVIFSLFSLLTFYRAFQTSIKLVLCYTAIVGFLDLVVFTLFSVSFFQPPSVSPHSFVHPCWLPTIANMLIFGYMVCSVRGFDWLSWISWLFFIFIDIFIRDIPSHTFLFPLAVHCVGYGIYLITTEILGFILEWATTRNQEKYRPFYWNYLEKKSKLKNSNQLPINFNLKTSPHSIGASTYISTSSNQNLGNLTYHSISQPPSNSLFSKNSLNYSLRSMDPNVDPKLFFHNEKILENRIEMTIYSLTNTSINLHWNFTLETLEKKKLPFTRPKEKFKFLENDKKSPYQKLKYILRTPSTFLSPTEKSEDEVDVIQNKVVTDGPEYLVFLNEKLVQKNIQFDFENRRFSIKKLIPSTNYKLDFFLKVNNIIRTSQSFRFITSDEGEFFFFF